MAGLVLNGVEIACRLDGSRPPDELIGERSRGMSGGFRSSVRARKRVWHFRTKPLPQARSTVKSADTGETWTLNGSAALQYTPGLGWVLLDGTSGTRVASPDSAPLDITGDLTIQAEIVLNVMAAGTRRILYRYPSYVFSVAASSALLLEWTPDGTTYTSATSTTNLAAAGIVAGQRVTVKVTADVDAGAGTKAIKFWWSTDGGTTWTQLGSTIAGAVTSFAASAVGLTLGADPAPSTTNLLSGKLFSAEVRSGIDGTIIARFDAMDCDCAEALRALQGTLPITASGDLIGPTAKSVCLEVGDTSVVAGIDSGAFSQTLEEVSFTLREV
jgi:hypothetical protein